MVAMEDELTKIRKMILEIRDNQLSLKGKLDEAKKEFDGKIESLKGNIADGIFAMTNAVDLNSLIVSFILSVTSIGGLRPVTLRTLCRKIANYFRTSPDELSKGLIKDVMKNQFSVIVDSAHSAGTSSEEFIRIIIGEMGTDLVKELAADERFKTKFLDVYGSEAVEKLKSLLT
ncbi:hypothetical protein ES703_14950 [subsurface metagenome]